MLMNVSFTKEQKDYISLQLKSGDYQNASEVVRDALRLMEEQDRFKEMKLQLLREEIQKVHRSYKRELVLYEEPKLPVPRRTRTWTSTS
jgi:putative addiction module CopG family antidote